MYVNYRFDSVFYKLTPIPMVCRNSPGKSDGYCASWLADTNILTCVSQRSGSPQYLVLLTFWSVAGCLAELVSSAVSNPDSWQEAQSVCSGECQAAGQVLWLCLYLQVQLHVQQSLKPWYSSQDESSTKQHPALLPAD